MIHWLNVVDVQNLAMAELGRKLGSEDIRKIFEPISENIDWADAIALAIRQSL